jgi:hypothetical protein
MWFNPKGWRGLRLWTVKHAQRRYLTTQFSALNVGHDKICLSLVAALLELSLHKQFKAQMIHLLKINPQHNQWMLIHSTA